MANNNESNAVERPMIIRLDDLVVEFASNLTLGMKAIVAAAETYVTAINKYPTKARDEFARRFPRIRKDTWQIFEDVGHGRLPPEAMMMLPGAVEKLREAKLNRRRFSDIANTTVSVYNPSRGKYEDVPFTHLTAAQADIILNPVTHDLRNAAQQKRYVEKMVQPVREKSRVRSADYSIEGDGIVVKRLTRLSLEDLRRIVSEIEGAA